MESHDLAGRAAIVTGASRGLGRAFALHLARSGANVTITARFAHGLEETASLLPSAAGAVEIVVGDVTDPAVAERAVARSVQRFGGVDVLVNNAGAIAVGSVADMDLDEWWDVLNVNVRGPLIWTRAVLPWMRARRAGTIINVSSRGAYTQHPYASAYCASKAALSQLTSCLAAEVADDGIIVLAFGPAALTGLARSLFETEAMPAGREASSTSPTSPPTPTSCSATRWSCSPSSSTVVPTTSPATTSAAASTASIPPDELRAHVPPS